MGKTSTYISVSQMSHLSHFARRNTAENRTLCVSQLLASTCFQRLFQYVRCCAIFAITSGLIRP